jgi:hypothetical protein
LQKYYLFSNQPNFSRIFFILSPVFIKQSHSVLDSNFNLTLWLLGL